MLPDQVGHKIDILLLQFTETVNRLCWSVEGLIVCIEDFVEQLEGFIKVMFFYIDQEEEAQEWIPEECCQLVVENMLQKAIYIFCVNLKFYSDSIRYDHYCSRQRIRSNGVLSYLFYPWLSHVEIEDYFVAYFNHIEVPYC